MQGLPGCLLSLPLGPAASPVSPRGVYQVPMRLLMGPAMGLACPFAGCWEAGWGPVSQVSPTPHWASLFRSDCCLVTHRMGVLGGSQSSGLEDHVLQRPIPQPVALLAGSSLGLCVPWDGHWSACHLLGSRVPCRSPGGRWERMGRWPVRRLSAPLPPPDCETLIRRMLLFFFFYHPHLFLP